MTTLSSERPSVLVTADFDDSVTADLANFLDVTVLPAGDGSGPLTARLSGDKLAGVSAIVCELDSIDADVLAACPRLRLVVSCRSNPVNVDTDACRASGVTVATTPARNADVTADLTFTLLLMTLRHASAAERWLRANNWDPAEQYEPYTTFRGVGLTGRTLGLVGAGAVGRRVAQRARGFGMEVIAFDPFAIQDDFADVLRLTTLEEVLSTSDVVSIHAPLNKATTGLIGPGELALMRPSAYLINAGRAAIVDESALVTALQSGAIAGAGLDVFWTEPLAHEHPLTKLDNVVLTPHIAGASDDVVTNHSAQAAMALRAWFDGTPVPNIWTR